MLTKKLPNAAASSLVVTSSATNLLSLIEVAAGESFSLAGLDAIDLQPEEAIRILADGNTPTTTNGLLVSSFKSLRGVDLTKLQLISVAGNVNCNIQVGFSKQGELDDTESSISLDPKFSSSASSATLVPNVDQYGFIDITAQAQALAINNPTGTPVNFQKLEIRIKDNGTARAITFDTAYTAGGIALPTTTTASKTLRLGFEYNSNTSKWELIALVEES